MIPVYSPAFGAEEKKYLNQCIDTGMVSASGPMVKSFEQKFAQKFGQAYAISVSSGTAALEVACYALGIGEGDEVIVPDQTIISCAWAVERVGARPVFVDVHEKTWNLTVDNVAKLITKKTKAIMAVHLFGQAAPVQELKKLAGAHGIYLIEDCAQAIGTRIQGQLAGSFGDVAIFSFFANKTIAIGEGGMVVTSKDRFAQQAQNYRNLQFGQGDNKFLHQDRGYNFRLTSLQAAVGLAQLERVDQTINRKVEIAQVYLDLLKDESRIQLPVEIPQCQHAHWMFAIVSKTKSNKEIIQKLAYFEIESRPFFTGMHRQKFWTTPIHPVSAWLSDFGFYLPSGLNLDRTTQIHIVQTLKQVL